MELYFYAQTLVLDTGHLHTTTLYHYYQWEKVKVLPCFIKYPLVHITHPHCTVNKWPTTLLGLTSLMGDQTSYGSEANSGTFPYPSNNILFNKKILT
jgi:hypothetical protein